MTTSTSRPETDGGTNVSDASTAETGSADGAGATEPGRSTGERVGFAVRSADRWLAAGLVALAVALAGNSLLGPLVTDAVEYPFSDTMVNQTIGLEAVTLALVAPWCLAAAVLILRGHRAGTVFAIPPSAYAAYMFAQYVVGPQYLEYQPVIAFHLGIFVLSGAVLAVAWSRIRPETLPTITEDRARRAAVGLFLLAAFVTSRYLPAFGAMATGGDLSAEAALDPTMYWTIVLLDLGVIVPVTVATGWALLRGAEWAERAVYGVAGWYVLVPVSVAAMGTAMWLNDDPFADPGGVAVLSVVAVLFTAFAVWVFRPLFGREPDAR